MRLLFVCTGNICRSAVAERLAMAWAEQSPIATTGISISSAGLSATEGRAMDPHSAAALRHRGGDPTNFSARMFTASMAEEADLVLTMTRRQRRAVLEAAPRGLRRTFTLREAADLACRIDVSDLWSLPPTDRVQELARRLHAGRAFRSTSEADDIQDPIGQPAKVHERVARQVAIALRPLTNALFLTTSRDMPADDGERSQGPDYPDQWSGSSEVADTVPPAPDVQPFRQGELDAEVPSVPDVPLVPDVPPVPQGELVPEVQPVPEVPPVPPVQPARRPRAR